MRTLILNDREVEQLLPMTECIDVMGEALRALARGNVMLPLRTVLRLPDSPNAFGLMPSVLMADQDGRRTTQALGAKIITVFPGNDESLYESHIGVVLLFDASNGRLLAIMDATSITAIRTAAVSGLATRLLAHPTAHELALLGSGVQAKTHLEAIRAVRPLSRVRVWSRNPERARDFAHAARERFKIDTISCDSAREAVEGAQIVCTVTSSRTPVLEGAWLSPGTHVNAVGASLPTARELDSEAVRRSRLYVDRRESVLNESGDFLLARAEGVITDAHIRGELGELLVGDVAGPESAEDITLFKSLGLAVEDLAAAQYLFERAQATDAGTWLYIGGARRRHA